MDDIASRAGLSKGTLYLYFSSKQELFEQLIESRTTAKIAEVETIVGHSTGVIPAIQALAKFAPTLILESDVPRLMKILIGESNNFPEIVRSYRQNVVERILRAITEMLKRSNASGETHIRDPHLFARLVVAPIAFSSMWQVVFGADPEAKVDLPGLFELHAELLGRALADSGGVS